MPNNDLERLIFKLELDDSGYIRGTEALSASTKKFTEQQEAANKVLQTNETLLKNQSDFVQQTKRDLEAYTGTNEKYRLQLQKSFQTAQADNLKLADTVLKNQQAYDAAAKSAQNFAETSAKASELQQQTTGGKIPAPSIVPQTISAGITQQIASVLNVPEFTAMAQAVEQTKQEFDDLRVSITLAEERMKQLNATDEEFQQLAPIVAKGKEALQQYDNITKQAVGSSISLRTEILNGNNELAKLQEAGKGASKQYEDLEKHVAHLTELYREQRERVKVLSSETRALDFGKAAIGAAISGFQVYTSIAILAGGASEELQKKTMQLFAAMQLLTALEQLANSVKRGSVLATNLQSAAHATYTAVVGASTGALKAFRLALLGTGIGAAIVLIGFLVSKWNDYKEAVKKAGENQKLLNEVVAEGNKEAGKQIADLKILTQAARDANLPMKERLDAIKQLQKEFPDYFGNLSKEAILTGDITKATKEATEAIIAASRARAAKGKIDAIENQRLDLEAEKQKIIDTATKEAKAVKKESATISTGGGVAGIGGGTVEGATVAQRRTAIAQAAADKLRVIKENDDALQQRAEFLTKFVGLDKIAKTIEDPDKGKKETDKKIHEIQNEFERKKAELDARLAALNAKEADNESKIRIEFATRLAIEQIAIEKLFKEKKLTRPQADDLKAEVGQINLIELNKALADLNKKTIDARQKLNDELLALQDKNIQDQLNLIQNEFERRAKLIDFNEQRELAASKENTQKRLQALDLQRLLIGEKAYQDAKAVIISTGEQNALNIIQDFAQKRQQLSFDMIQKLGDDLNKLLDSQNLGLSRSSQIEIDKQNELFQTGKISFEQYQKALTKIGKDEGEKRVENEIKSLRRQINLFTQELQVNNDKLSEDQKEKLLDKIRSLEKQLADLEKGNVPKDPGTSETALDRVAKYAAAIGEVAQSVISFWQAANEAEQAALERSIALQEKRVNAAQRIADRGNAQYLKQEEDRLTQLNIQKENAARKQLAINAALQASEIIVALISGLAQGAKIGGALGAIADVAAIVAAIAGAFAIAQSLKPPTPSFFKGTTDVQRDGHPAGIDTIPAWLTEHEAIIPPEKNKKYKKSVEAIYHGKVPAEDMNEFVQNYVRNKVEKNTKSDIATNKKTTEDTDIINTVRKVLNETTDKKITSNINQVISKLVNERIEKRLISSDFQNSLVSKNVSIDNIKKYSEIINKIVDIKIKEDTYKQFVQNVSKVPAKVLNSFIENYPERKFFKGTPDLKGKAGIDKIPIWASQGEAIIPKDKNNIYKPVISAIFKDQIPPEQLNNFVNNYHTIKPVPQVNYQRIKEAAELHVTQDGRMSVLLSEHNKKMDESMDLQRATIRALKSMGVNVNVDKNGLAMSVMEVVEQIKIDRRV